MQASKRRRVLVVDDNVDTARTLAFTIKLMGHDTRVAFEGETALQAAADFRPDVVLLDIGLPGADGYEVVRRMRLMPQLAAARIAAITGYGGDENRRKGLAAGFDDYFVKPVAPDDIGRLLVPAGT